MPRAQTEQFGEIEYGEESSVTFPHGLPGFDACRRFVLIETPGLAPLVHLQSLEIPGLCFLALPVRAIEADYETALSSEDRSALGLGQNGLVAPPLLDLALLSAGPEGGVTANLLAPVVVNLAMRIAVQAVRGDQRYSHQHALGDVGRNPCS